MDGWSNQREFVRYLLHRTGWTQTTLAKRAGLDPSTLSRFLSGPDSDAELRPSTIQRLEQATGLSPKTDAPPTESLQGFAEATPLGQGESPQVVAQQVAANSGTDPWVLNSRVLDLAGYLPGDILFVKLGETPLRGDVVCAQHYDWTAGKAETLFRIFDPPYLVASSTEAKLTRPFSVTDDTISIKGVVISSIRVRQK